MLKVFNKKSNKESVIENNASAINKQDLFYSVLIERYYEDEEKDFSIFVNEKEIELENIFTLKINVKSVGSFYAFFEKETFDKDAAVNSISELKNLDVSTLENTEKKITELAKKLTELKSLFVIATNKRSSFFSLEKLCTIISLPLLYVEEKSLLNLNDTNALFSGGVGLLGATTCSFGIYYYKLSNLLPGFALLGISLIASIFSGIILGNCIKNKDSNKIYIKGIAIHIGGILFGGLMYAAVHYLMFDKTDIIEIVINFAVGFGFSVLISIASCLIKRLIINKRNKK